MYGPGATSGTTGATYTGKFNSNNFGQHLLKGAMQKENSNSGIAQSQNFTSGFSKFIGDGQREDKVDPSTLPLAVNQ